MRFHNKHKMMDLSNLGEKVTLKEVLVSDKTTPRTTGPRHCTVYNVHAENYLACSVLSPGNK